MVQPLHICQKILGQKTLIQFNKEQGFWIQKNYSGFCFYLAQFTNDSYNLIVAHEDVVRNRPVTFDVSNRELNNQYREAVLDQMLNLTRNNVIYDALNRDYLATIGLELTHPTTEELIESNTTSLFEFLQSYSTNFAQDTGHARTQSLFRTFAKQTLLHKRK